MIEQPDIFAGAPAPAGFRPDPADLPAAKPAGRGGKVAAWELERRRENSWRRQQRAADVRLATFDHSAELALLDRSIAVLRSHLKRESRVAAGGGEA